MKEFNNFEFSIDNNGTEFYLKWRKDTIISTFVIAPAMFIFYLLCTTLIVGVSIKLFLILLLPIAIIIAGLVYSPYFLRGKYINHTVKSISINNGILSIETYKWFTYKAICISTEITPVECREVSDIPFFKGKEVFILNAPNFGVDHFYVIGDFFENIHDSIRQLVTN